MSTSEAVSRFAREARPYIEQHMEIAEVLAGMRNAATAAGIDWSQLKALIKAQIQDEQDNGERVQKIIDKADFACAYADMLGFANVNEKSFSEPAEATSQAPATRQLERQSLAAASYSEA